LLSPLIHLTLGMNTNHGSTKLGFSFLVRYLGWGVTNCESSLTVVKKKVIKSRILFSMAASVYLTLTRSLMLIDSFRFNLIRRQ